LEQREGVGLLAGGAAGAPDAQPVAARGQGRHYLARERLEDSAVAGKAGDRDRGETVEQRPFAGMRFEVSTVGVEVG
jgi:hypothetical protein